MHCQVYFSCCAHDAAGCECKFRHFHTGSNPQLWGNRFNTGASKRIWWSESVNLSWSDVKGNHTMQCSQYSMSLSDGFSDECSVCWTALQTCLFFLLHPHCADTTASNRKDKWKVCNHFKSVLMYFRTQLLDFKAMTERGEYSSTWQRWRINYVIISKRREISSHNYKDPSFFFICHFFFFFVLQKIWWHMAGVEHYSVFGKPPSGGRLSPNGIEIGLQIKAKLSVKPAQCWVTINYER